MSSRSEEVKRRHAIAMDNVYAIGQYLIMQPNCPQNVRDAWRTLNDYIRNKKD